MIVRRSGLVVSVLLLATLPAAAQAPATRAHVQTLASEKFAGREAGSAGERLAADYIASQLARIGAKPLPGRNDMFVPFTFSAGSRDNGSRAVVGSTTFSTTKDAMAATAWSNNRGRRNATRC